MRAKLVLLAPLLVGCPDRTISGVPVEQGKVETKTIPAVPRTDLDVLFVIDDSGSMKEEHESLKRNFGDFIAVLESLDGGLPNVHIGVITPDLGTSATDGTTAGNLGGCNGPGKNGELRVLPGTSERYLRSVDDGMGGRATNFGTDLTAAFASLADVGTTGCGIEQHLESMKRALDNHPANAGFLRRDAALAVIVIADEDDCSLAKSSLFAGNAAGDPRWGDKVNFRCTSEGVACDSPSTDLATPGRREDCHPDFASTTLTGVDRYVDFLKGLKADTLDVMVAGIVGDADPFEVIADDGVSVLKPSCDYTDAMTGTQQFAFPAVRTRDFLSRFPQRNAATTICDGTLADGLTEIGALIKEAFVDPCFKNQLADVDPATPGAQYECAVTEVRRRPNQPPEELAVVPACDATMSRTPCWRIEADAEKCFYTNIDPHLKLVIERGAQVPEPDLYVQASCVTTDGGGDLR